MHCILISLKRDLGGKRTVIGEVDIIIKFGIIAQVGDMEGKPVKLNIKYIYCY